MIPAEAVKALVASGMIPDGKTEVVNEVVSTPSGNKRVTVIITIEREEN